MVLATSEENVHRYFSDNKAINQIVEWNITGQLWMGFHDGLEVIDIDQNQLLNDLRPFFKERFLYGAKIGNIAGMYSYDFDRQPYLKKVSSHKMMNPRSADGFNRF